MTHAYSIDTPSSDDTDWILLDFEEPAAEKPNVRDKKTTPLPRKPVKKTSLKKPQAETGSTSRNTAEKAENLKAAPSIPAHSTTSKSTAADLKTPKHSPRKTRNVKARCS